VWIHYFQTLQFADGWYEFLFPTAFNSKGRSGHPDVPVSLNVDVNAGAAIADLQCPNHAVVKESSAPEHCSVQLRPDDGFPNEDFELRFRLAKGQSAADLMTYRDERGGYFTLLLHSPNDGSPLNNVKIDWGAMQASEIYSRDFTNVPPGRGVLVAGRFSGTVTTAVVVTGTAGDQPVSFSIPVDLEKNGSEKELPKIWARAKIGKLATQSAETGDLEFLRETRQVALGYGLVSPFTALLTVDASAPTEEINKITVPAVP
jgi:hypothetical protein